MMRGSDDERQVSSDRHRPTKNGVIRHKSMRLDFLIDTHNRLIVINFDWSGNLHLTISILTSPITDRNSSQFPPFLRIHAFLSFLPLMQLWNRPLHAMDLPHTSKKEVTPRVATRQSSRRIVKKTRPDYIEDFSGRAASTDEEPRTPSKLKQLLSSKPPAVKKPSSAPRIRNRKRVRAKREVTAEPRTPDLSHLQPDLQAKLASIAADSARLRGFKCRMCDELFDDPAQKLTCQFCQASYHVNCQQQKMPGALACIRQNGFICVWCTRCEGCQKDSKEEKDRLYLCGQCSLGYHGKCHQPPLDRNKVSLIYLECKWVCGKCEAKDAPAVETTADKAVDAEEPESMLPAPDETLSSSATARNLSSAVVNGESDRSPRMHLSVQRENPVDVLVEPVPGPNPHNGLTNGFTNGFSDSEDVSQASVISSKMGTTFFPPTADTDDESPSSPEAKAFRQKLARWSPNQCAEEFFDSYPELSELIIKHNLFGSSLMILSRAQFMDLFELKVGTALKMHYAISKWRRAFF